MLRIKGAWLSAAGFPPGASVVLTVCSPGVIEIRLNAPPPDSADFARVLQSLAAATVKASWQRQLAHMESNPDSL
jgi:hypothetical protein